MMMMLCRPPIRVHHHHDAWQSRHMPMPMSMMYFFRGCIFYGSERADCWWQLFDKNKQKKQKNKEIEREIKKKKKKK